MIRNLGFDRLSLRSRVLGAGDCLLQRVRKEGRGDIGQPTLPLEGEGRRGF